MPNLSRCKWDNLCSCNNWLQFSGLLRGCQTETSETGHDGQSSTFWKIPGKVWKKWSFITEMFVCILTDEVTFRHFEVIIVVSLTFPDLYMTCWSCFFKIHPAVTFLISCPDKRNSRLSAHTELSCDACMFVSLGSEVSFFWSLQVNSHTMLTWKEVNSGILFSSGGLRKKKQELDFVASEE